MAKRDWLTFAAIAGLGYAATTLTVCVYFEGIGDPLKTVSLAGVLGSLYFPGFALSGATLFALLRRSMRRQGNSLKGRLFRCWLLAAAMAALTPLFPMCTRVLEGFFWSSRNLRNMSEMALMGLQFGGAFVFLLGIVLAVIFHNNQEAENV